MEKVTQVVRLKLPSHYLNDLTQPKHVPGKGQLKWRLQLEVGNPDRLGQTHGLCFAEDPLHANICILKIRGGITIE